MKKTLITLVMLVWMQSGVQALIELAKSHWSLVLTIGSFFYGAWSVFWSFAPAPRPDQPWYSAIFHTAQFMSMSPGRSIGLLQSRLEAGTNSRPKDNSNEKAG